MIRRALGHQGLAVAVQHSGVIGHQHPLQHCAAAGVAIIRSSSCTTTRAITQATNLVGFFFLLSAAAERPPPEAIVCRTFLARLPRRCGTPTCSTTHTRNYTPS